jgi:hypothetical protein
MNWQNQLAGSIRAAVEVTVAAADETDIIRANLLDAAKLYDARSDGFAQGKGAICRDMAEKLNKFGSFASDKQRDFAMKLIEWTKPRAPREPNTQASSVFNVPHLFAVMQKHSTFHAGSLKITRRNQDTLCWLVWNNVCIGKLEDGRVTLFGKRIHAAGALAQTVTDILRAFEAAPLETAKQYGRLSGRCASCGRDLTDPESIAAGIGPICANKFN